MKDVDSDSSIILLMHDVSRLIRKAIDARAKALGLTQTQWRTLVHIERNEGCSQAAIAEILEITPISMSRLLDRLESSNWIERRPNPCDRRAFQLHITAKAQPILMQIKEFAREQRAVAFQGIRDEEIEAFIQTLRRMKLNLSQS